MNVHTLLPDLYSKLNHLVSHLRIYDSIAVFSWFPPNNASLSLSALVKKGFFYHPIWGVLITVCCLFTKILTLFSSKVQITKLFSGMIWIFSPGCSLSIIVVASSASFPTSSGHSILEILCFSFHLNNLFLRKDILGSWF